MPKTTRRSPATPSSRTPNSGARAERKRRAQSLGRDQLLDAAEEVFGRKGFHETSLREIAELAEFSVGSVYSFFENKDDLFAQIFERRGAEFMPALRAIAVRDDDPMQLLHELVDFEIAFFRSHPHFGRLYLRYANGATQRASRQIDQVTETRYHEAMTLQSIVFSRGQANGSMRSGDPDVLARLFSGMIAAYQSLDPAVMSDDPTAAERLALTELHAIVAAAFSTASTVRRDARGRPPRPAAN